MSLKDMFTKEDDEKEAPKSEQDKAERVSKPGERYSENELMVRLKFIIGCSLAFTLIGIVFTVLYSIMFVTQPLNAISPIDQKFFELIIPVEHSYVEHCRVSCLLELVKKQQWQELRLLE